MQRTLLTVLVVTAAIGLVSCAPSVPPSKATPTTAAETTSPAATTRPATATSPAEQKQAGYRKSAEKRAKEALEALGLKDPAKEKKVHDLIVAYVPTLMAWQDQNAPKIKGLWKQWKTARSDETDRAKADDIMTQIDAVYATWKPQHDAFWGKLATVLTGKQVEKVKDRYTDRKLPVTYNAYLAIFPTLTDKQKAFTLANLKDAREQALDARSTTEKSDIFKKYKIKIEAQLDREGVDTQKHRQEFAAKQKQQAATKKAATQPTTRQATQPATNPKD